jgi:exosortase A-associated hydrolase 2
MGSLRAALHVPAFAEEMNKSRRMVALQVRELAEQGYAVLELDLFGTGDSCGNFGEASWSIWLQNVADAVAWLRQQGAQTITLWGLRLGGLLAMDFVSQHPGVVDNLVVWQPILNADSFVTQFLRLRVAAAMMNNAIPQEKTSDLKNQLQQGNALEVAGYLLNPDLINPLTALKIAPVALKTLKNILLFEVVMAEDTQPNFLNQQFLDGLLKFGVDADLITVVGDSFWASQEITTAPALLQATSEYVKQW